LREKLRDREKPHYNPLIIHDVQWMSPQPNLSTGNLAFFSDAANEFSLILRPSGFWPDGSFGNWLILKIFRQISTVEWKGKVRAKGTAIENLMCGGALYSVRPVDPDIS
jgi:hypothetical protein